MKKTLLLVMVAMLATGFLWSQTTMHYWSFNVGENSELDASTNTPTSIPADIGDGVINHDLSFSTFGGSPINTEPDYVQGVALCPAGTVNNGKQVDIVFSTEGYENIVFSFAAQRTAAGYNNNTIEVSSDDGVTWETVVSGLLLPSSFALFTYNLTAIDADVDDNPDVIVRLTLDVADGVTGGGNNRYDNVKITGDPLTQGPSISNIIQTPDTDITSTTTVSVSADVSPNDGDIQNVELYWGTETGNWINEITMTVLIDTETYVTDWDIDVQEDGTTVYYVIRVQCDLFVDIWSDEQSYTVWDPKTTTLPYEEAFDSDLGDCYTYAVSGIKPWYHGSSSAICNGWQGVFPEEHWLVLPGIDFDEYNDVVMTFTNYAQHGTIDENNYLKLFYSTDYPGIGDPSETRISWTELSFNQPPGGTVGGTEIETFSGIIDLADLSGNQVYLAFKYYSDGSPTRWRIDDIDIFEALDPILTVAPESLTGFVYYEGDGPSDVQSYNLSGINLEPADGNVVVTVDEMNEYFEVSLAEEGIFTNSVSVPYTGGTLAETEIFVRLKEDLAEGSYFDVEISNDGGGDTKIVTVSGSVIGPLTTEIPFTTDFGVADNWEGPPTGYNPRTYEEGGWFFYGENALRCTTYPFGDSDYSFRERVLFTVTNLAPVTGMTGFSFQLLDWMTGDGADRDLNISFDGGDSWETVLTINKDWFDDYQVFQPFEYYFGSPQDFAAEDFIISIGDGDTNNANRINIGQFKAFDTYPEIPPAGTEITVGDVTINVSHDGDDPISYNPNPADPPEIPGGYTPQLLFSVTGTPGETVIFTFGPTDILVGYWYDNSIPGWDGPHNNDGGFITLEIAFNSEIFITLGDPEADPPLPVELSSFTAAVTANQFVKIQWITATETNMLGYNIYRCTVNSLEDAIKINPVIIEAMNSSTQQKYDFLDEDVELETTYYYWLEANELNLTSQMHGPISIFVTEEEDIPVTPYPTKLIGAFPNPFNPDTRIAFSLAQESNVTITIYNSLGQLIRKVADNERFDKGHNQLLWDGRDSSGREVGSGIYFYKMKADIGYTMIKKMALIK